MFVIDKHKTPTIKKMEEQPTNKKNIFAKHISDKQLSWRTRIIKTRPRLGLPCHLFLYIKVCWDIVRLIHLCLMWLFSWYKAKFNSCDRNLVVHNAWNIHSDPLEKKSVNPIKTNNLIFKNEQENWTKTSQMKMYGWPINMKSCSHR